MRIRTRITSNAKQQKKVSEIISTSSKRYNSFPHSAMQADRVPGADHCAANMKPTLQLMAK